MPPSASSLVNSLLLDLSRGEQSWRQWRAETILDDLDSASLSALPLLAGRLPSWLVRDSQRDPDRERILGICKRAWAQNQLRYRELITAWNQLSEAGVAPFAVAGCAAWSLLYLEERSVRPIQSIDIVVSRHQAMLAKQVLEASGWHLEDGMPEPTGHALDTHEGLWFRAASETALFLRWRIRAVSPERAAENETAPSTQPHDLHGTAISVLATEELLLDALTRDADSLIWQCDAAILLRNRSVDWPRLFELAKDAPLAEQRLTVLRDEGLAIPALPVRRNSRGALRRRLERIHADYRRVAWSRQMGYSPFGFFRYLLYRLWRAFAPGDLPSGALTVIDASGGSGSSIFEYRRHWTLFYFLTIRDIRLRYRKTWRGVMWALVQPLLPMVIFGAVLSGVMRPEVGPGPYWLFVLAGLVPWSFFSSAANYSAVTFVNNFGLLNKVYFPRAILPAAAVSACLLDLLVSSCVLIALCWWNGYPPRLGMFLFPPLILVTTLVAAAFGLAAASLNVLYRDLKPLVPFLIQVAMYATPVLYPLSMVPSSLRWLMWLNPMTGIVEGFRGSLLGSSVDWTGEAISAIAGGGLIYVAAWLFRKVEADLAERT